jgi:AmmeMemoRadiSam system protein B/AmmeMemoRadiSam system protein A
MVKAAVLMCFFLLSSTVPGGSPPVVREPAVADQFYPADRAGLAATVRNHLQNVKDVPRIDGELIALIVPHAGLVYSGQVAAYSYRLLENSGVERVILCGPTHHFAFEGVSVYGPGVTWKTPLGNVACDDSLCNLLLKYDPRIAVIREAHEREHCLEVQLPYLQTVLPDCRIVPALVGYPPEPAVDLLARALESLKLDRHTVMIASTDWQHYRPAGEGWKMDSLGIACLERLDATALEKNLRSGQVEMCGGSGAVAILKAAIARGANRVKILKYGDSGDVSGDKSSVVGYVAAAIYKAPVDHKQDKEPASGQTDSSLSPPEVYQLSDADKRRLLEIARQSIKSYLESGKLPDINESGVLGEPGAAFVTLEKDGNLRGCIGHTVATGPLCQTVSVCAVQAAVSDPRFPPVRAAELDRLDIEISVLTPLRPIKLLDEIEVGRDGLMIEKGQFRGLLLPQVATDYDWNRTQFLEHTCNKAGLPTDAYKSSDAVIYKFQALVFGEKDMR